MDVAIVYTTVVIVLIAFAYTLCGHVCLSWICDRLRRRLDSVVLGTFTAELGTPIGSVSVVIGIAVAEETLRI